MKKPFLAALAVTAFGLAGQVASADILLNLTSIVPDGGGFAWTYSADLEPDTNLRVSDFFVMYDVAGLVPGSATFTPAVAHTFSLTETGTGASVPFTVPTHDFAGELNINVAHSGGTTITPAGQVLHLGDLTFHSTFGAITTGGEFASITQQGSSNFYAIGLVELPAVPEPASLASLLAPAAFLMRRRR